MADEERDLIPAGEYVVFRHEREVGLVIVHPDEEPHMRTALEGAGYELRPQQTEADAVFELGRECELGKDERPCEITVALGIAQELGREAGVDTYEVDALESQGAATEEEARRAVEAVVARLPDDMRSAGEELLRAAFGEDTDAASAT